MPQLASQFARLFFLLFFLTASGQNAEGAIRQVKVQSEITSSSTSILSTHKKGKKKLGFWKRLKVKFGKAKPKERKSKFGRIGLLLLAVAIVSLVVTDIFFGLALLGAVVFGFIGLFKDEKKTAAILAIVLPTAFVVLAVIAAVNALDD